MRHERRVVTSIHGSMSPSKRSARAEAPRGESFERGVVLRATGGFFRVRAESGDFDCRMRGRLKKHRIDTDIAVIGDEVEIDIRESIVESVLPRRTRFSRLHPTSRGRPIEDVLVANLDRLLIVMSASLPKMNPRLLDRFLVIAEHNDVEAVIVANKMDEPESSDAKERFGVYETIGYQVAYVSAHRSDGVESIRELVRDRISALTGPSGVGKSSLINAIAPDLGLLVGEIGQYASKGRHTTRVAELHPLPFGGFLADTPGIRELASFQISPRELAHGFREMRAFVGQCGFSDCLHRSEPDCAIRAAVKAGEIRAERYDSYLRQLAGE